MNGLIIGFCNETAAVLMYIGNLIIRYTYYTNNYLALYTCDR